MDLTNEAVTRLRARRDAINQFLAAYELCQALDGPLFPSETIDPIRETTSAKRDTNGRKAATNRTKRETKAEKRKVHAVLKSVAARPIRTTADLAAPFTRVLAVVGADPISSATIAERSGVPASRVLVELKKAIGCKAIIAHGAPTSPRRVYTRASPGATKPTGAPPSTKPGPEFDVAWNGVQERVGDAPGLSGHRQRMS